MPERDNTRENCQMLKLIFSKYDACKVFQVNYITAILLDFLTEKIKVRYCATRPWSYSWGCFPAG